MHACTPFLAGKLMNSTAGHMYILSLHLKSAPILWSRQEDPAPRTTRRATRTQSIVAATPAAKQSSSIVAQVPAISQFTLHPSLQRKEVIRGEEDRQGRWASTCACLFWLSRIARLPEIYQELQQAQRGLLTPLPRSMSLRCNAYIDPDPCPVPDLDPGLVVPSPAPRHRHAPLHPYMSCVLMSGGLALRHQTPAFNPNLPYTPAVGGHQSVMGGAPSTCLRLPRRGESILSSRGSPVVTSPTSLPSTCTTDCSFLCALSLF